MIEEYEIRLRSMGYRITPQREMIVESLNRSQQHITAEEIFNQLQERTHALNIATVYRTLELLVEEGLACRNDLGGGKVVYSPNLHGPHMHLVCRRCGNIIDGDSQLIAPLGPQLQALYGFLADLHHISIDGECQECQQDQLTSQQIQRA